MITPTKACPPFLVNLSNMVSYLKLFKLNRPFHLFTEVFPGYQPKNHFSKAVTKNAVVAEAKALVIELTKPAGIAQTTQSGTNLSKK